MDLIADLLSLDAPSMSPADGASPAIAHAAPVPQRGPMRPANLTATRRRLSGAVLSQRFRQIDFALLAMVLFAGLQTGGGVNVLDMPLRALLPLVVEVVLVLWALKVARAYAFSPRESLWLHLGKIVAATVAATLGGGLIALMLDGGFQNTALFCVFCTAALLIAHVSAWIYVRGGRARGLLTPNVVVVGATANAGRLIKAALNTRDAAILGVFDDRMSRIPSHIQGVPVLGTTQSLLTHKLLPYIDRIVITVTPSAQHRVSELIDRLKFLPNVVTLFMDVEGVEGQRSTLARLADAPLAHVSGVRQDESKAGAKRIQDIILSALALIAAAPVILVIALAVRLDSPGPVFFRQRRHGFNNETIEVWKFRSMRHEASDATAAQQVWAGDDRVTRVGRVIRGLSLDELPQLWNVIKGEMSLVGPRPHAIGMKTAGEDSARLVAEYAWRHRVKPGITGWAQINGSIGAVDTPELVQRRVALDVEYIERQSFWFDLRILIATLPALIRVRNVVR